MVLKFLRQPVGEEEKGEKKRKEKEEEEEEEEEEGEGEKGMSLFSIKCILDFLRFGMEISAPLV